MKFYLMHKDIQAASLNINNETGRIKSVFNISAPEHLPIGVEYAEGKADKYALDEWWEYRCIPNRRTGIEDALKKLKVQNTLALAVRGNALSLTDKYWIKPTDSDLKWADVNFVDNPNFSDHVGKAIRRHNWVDSKALDYRSPDITTNGNLFKYWLQENGKPYLVKGGSLPFNQQPFNEIIASAIARKLGIPHVEYTLHEDAKPFCRCDCFVTQETELVSAWQIYRTIKKKPEVSTYSHFINCCKQLGIKDAVQSINQMIVLDYIIVNEDRHLNNFGFLRNAETLEWIGFAPIFDSGTSLGYNRPSFHSDEFRCKPFKNTHAEQIKLVSSFDWIDFSKLDNIENEITEIFAVKQAEPYIDPVRCKDIAALVRRGIEYVRKLAQCSESCKLFDDINDDVVKDTAIYYDR
ncbi:MAG: HipA domain-containing protein [Ruminiclostridium sp.]|nr:HipA domain-containing protein [Ruminiclostridium sp.]